MSALEDNADEFRNFPKVLRELVEDELRAGNEVVEFGHGFPAAPCGAYIKLAQLVGTRERTSTPELHFYERNSSSYSGEFTDANRHFFVLEPASATEVVSEKQATRAAVETRGAASQPNEIAPPRQSPTQTNQPSLSLNSIVARFVKSMEINYDKWREGEGYDLSLLDEADDGERKTIEQIVLQQSPFTWRGIQALAKINSPRGRAAMLDAFLNADTQTRMAVHTYAPELLTDQLRTDSLIRALRESEIYYGLSEALYEIEDFHPQAVIDELLRGLMKRDGATACHFAAMLFFLHGKSSSAFDWEHRPFFLRFNTDNLIDRGLVAQELCKVIGVEPPTVWNDHW